MITAIGVKRKDSPVEWTIKIELTQGDLPVEVQRQMTMAASKAARECLEGFWNPAKEQYEFMVYYKT